jgi:F-type H+-transporting ATPase subunit epsilon
MSFQCTVVTPEQQALDESAEQVVLPAHDGQVGILTGRAPLLVKLGVGPLRVDLAGGGRRVFLVDGGVAQMRDDKLTVLTTIATPADHIDVSAARADLAKAEAEHPTDPAGQADRRRRMDRAKAAEAVAGQR